MEKTAVNQVGSHAVLRSVTRTSVPQDPAWISSGPVNEAVKDRWLRRIINDGKEAAAMF